MGSMSSINELKAANNHDARRTNINTVLRFYMEKGQDTAQSVAASTGLSIPTVSNIIKDFEKKGIVTQAGLLESSGGRRPLLYSMNYNLCCAIGIDIFREQFRAVLTDLKSEIIAEESHVIRFEDSLEYWQSIKKYVDDFVKDHKPEGTEYVGMGISLPCLFERENEKQILMSYRLGKNSINADYIYEVFGADVELMNTGDFAAYYAIHDKPYINNAIAYIHLNRDIEGAILPKGFRPDDDYNRSSRIGKFAHATLVPGGRTCTCGQKGCMNAYCSANAVIHQINDNTDEERRDIQLLFDGIKEGNEEYAKIWDEYLEYLAIFVNNLRQIMDCDVIIGGYVSTYIKEYESLFREKVDSKNAFKEKCDYLSIAKYGRYDACLGAAIRVLSKHINRLGEE